MKITVSSRPELIDDAVRQDISARISGALRSLVSRIDEVAVHIADVVGTRGHPQRLCRLSVRMTRIGSFSIETVEDTIALAVSRAAERATKQSQQILDRQR